MYLILSENYCVVECEIIIVSTNKGNKSQNVETTFELYHQLFTVMPCVYLQTSLC